MKIIVLLALLLLASETFANNSFIPNYYRNRRVQNEYSALGWSDRKEASLEYMSETEKSKTDGVDDGDTKTTDIKGNVFYRANENMNVEFVLNKTEEKPDGASKEDTTAWDLGLGYQFNELPMAVGVSYDTEDTDTDDTKTYNLGWGYKLNNNFFIGLGYTNLKNDISTGGDSTTTRTDVGGGYVWGDLKKPDAAVELVYSMYGDDADGSTISAQGLWNHDAAQYYLKVATLDTKLGTTDVDGSVYVFGVDYELGQNIYVGPEIQMSDITAKGTPDTENTQTNWSLEVGYRNEETMEYFARYSSRNTKREFDPSETKLTTSGFTVGGTYFF